MYFYWSDMKQSIKDSFWTALLTGIFFIAMGLLIVLFPMILVILLSAMLISIGIAFIINAVSIHRAGKAWERMPGWFW
jgi:uncharacterized membrane protein HdeD (DUF308 family)